FFFQAEDGIRDRNVTGVQTCALPIWCLGRRCLIEKKVVGIKKRIDEEADDGCIGKQHDVDVQHGFPSYRDRTCDDNKEASPGNSTMMNEELPEPKMWEVIDQLRSRHREKREAKAEKADE